MVNGMNALTQMHRSPAGHIEESMQHNKVVHSLEKSRGAAVSPARPDCLGGCR